MNKLIIFLITLNSAACFAGNSVTVNEPFANEELQLAMCIEAHYELGDPSTTEEQIEDYCLNQHSYTLTEEIVSSEGEVTIKKVKISDGQTDCEMNLFKVFGSKKVNKENGEIIYTNDSWEIAIAGGLSWCL